MNYRGLQAACKEKALKTMKNAKSLHPRCQLRHSTSRDVCTLLQQHQEANATQGLIAASTSLIDTNAPLGPTSTVPIASITWLQWNPCSIRQKQGELKVLIDQLSTPTLLLVTETVPEMLPRMHTHAYATIHSCSLQGIRSGYSTRTRSTFC
eukprot:3567720-Amphidinium_carterae.3